MVATQGGIATCWRDFRSKCQQSWHQGCRKEVRLQTGEIAFPTGPVQWISPDRSV